MQSTPQNPITRLRQTVQERRRALAAQDVAELSAKICRRFLSSVGFFPWEKSNVAVYRAFGHELDLTECAKGLRALGAVIHYPRMVQRPGESALGLEFCPVSTEAGPWSKGNFGIDEPPAAVPALRPGSLDLVFVPGVVYGPKGQRVGRGQGFYDRFLPNCAQALRVALAFDLQVIQSEDVPQADWDQAMDWIVTESTDYRPDLSRNGRFNQWFSLRGWKAPELQ